MWAWFLVRPAAPRLRRCFGEYMYFHRGLVWYEFFLIVRRDRVVIYARCVMTKPSEYTFYGTYSRRRREVRQSMGDA